MKEIPTIIDHLPESVVMSMISQGQDEAVTFLTDHEIGSIDIFHEDNDCQIDLICLLSGNVHVHYDECCITDEKSFSDVVVRVYLKHSEPQMSESLKRELVEKIETEIEEYLIA